MMGRLIYLFSLSFLPTSIAEAERGGRIVPFGRASGEGEGGVRGETCLGGLSAAKMRVGTRWSAVGHHDGRLWCASYDV